MSAAMTSPPPSEEQVLRAAYQATRALLRASDPAAAQAIVIDLCEKVGATVVPADGNDAAALPINVTLGDGDPMVLLVDSPEVLRLVTRYVVPAVGDARQVVFRRDSEVRLNDDATRDALTGLWNRRSLVGAINLAGPGDIIAMLDLDHFKKVNDTHGHAAGDEVLAQFAEFLRRGLRHLDIVGRLGGEEFVVIFPHTTVDEAARRMCQLRSGWAPVAPYGTTFSAGVAGVLAADHTEGTRPGQDALARADVLLYEAKAAGRNRVVCEGALAEYCGGDAG